MTRFGWLVIFCLASLSFLAGGAWAADFCVSTATDLQTALTTAQSNGEDDTIQVVQGTYKGNFTYSSSEGKNITLEGGYTAGCASRVVNPANTVLDGNSSSRALNLYNSSGGNIGVDGFTIQHGVVTGNGGGVYAYSYSASGTSGTITLTNNTISGNTATYGGGVYAGSYSKDGSGNSVTLTNNTISGNTSSLYGGGVYAESSSKADLGHIVTLSDNTISGNTSIYGGGIYAVSYATSGTSATILFTDNTISGNTSSYGGGGVYAESRETSGTAGTVLFTNNVVTGNTASQYGGGVIASSYAPSGTVGAVTCTNNTITENDASQGGGGLMLYAKGHRGGTVNCYNNIVWKNGASAGGDVYLYKSSLCVANGYNNDYATMTGEAWNNSGNNINSDPLFIGGGDYRLQSGSPCKDAGDNSAPGLPATDFEGDPRIIDGIVDIGAYEVSFLTTCVSDATELQAALTAAQGNGKNDIIMVVQGTYTRTGNFAYESSEGYSITLLGGYTAGCTDRAVNPANTILDGSGSGGALFLHTTSSGNIYAEGFTIQNGSSGSYGGGVYAQAETLSGTAGDVTLVNNIIADNTTATDGGGVFANSSSNSGTAGITTLLNNIVTGNTANNNGGGVAGESATSSGTAGTFILLNNIITGNTANNNGGGVFVESSAGASGTAGPLTLTNNTIAENGAGQYGGGVCTAKDGNTVNSYNNIIWGNTATTAGGDIYLFGSVGTANNYNNDYAVIEGSSWDNEDGNIHLLPLFVGAGDYHLQPTSPCIDKGDNSAPSLPANDIDGDARIINGTVDIGADEYSGLVLATPANGTIFGGCTFINKYQPSFRWRFTEAFKSFTIYFSTSPTNFTSKLVLITKASISGTTSSWTPSSGTWGKIIAASYSSGSIRTIYWKVIGTRTNKSTVSSAVWNFTIDDPYPPEILLPAGPYPVSLSASTPPTFQFDTNCNIKFQLEISSVSDFSDPKKIKAFTYTIKDPTAQPTLPKTLSASQWKAVQKLIGAGTGYFRVRGWDTIKRETASVTDSFTITP